MLAELDTSLPSARAANGQERILVTDVNGLIYRHKKKEYGHLVDFMVTDNFVAHLKDVAQIPHTEMTIDEKLRAVLGLDQYPLTGLDKSVARMLKWGKWRTLKKEDYTTWNYNRIMGCMLGRAIYDRKYAEYFQDYELPDENVEALQVISKKKEIVAASGLPYAARSRFFVEMARVLPHLKSSLTAVLNPDLDTVSGVHIKMALVELLAEGALGYPVDVELADDDRYIAEMVAGILNKRVFLSIDRNIEQNHKFKTKDNPYPKCYSPDNGEIVLASPLTKIAEAA